jgi:hypothetical protein
LVATFVSDKDNKGAVVALNIIIYKCGYTGVELFPHSRRPLARGGEAEELKKRQEKMNHVVEGRACIGSRPDDQLNAERLN